jgi:hypothetical protein
VRPAQWIEVEIAIAAATLAPTAHTVSKMWLLIDARLDISFLSARALDFDFFSFLCINTSFAFCPPKRKIARRAMTTSAAMGFEPNPTPEARKSCFPYSTKSKICNDFPDFPDLLLLLFQSLTYKPVVSRQHS